MGILKKFKETITIANEDISTTTSLHKDINQKKQSTKADKVKEKLITGFDEVNKKESYLRERQEIHSRFELFWTWVQLILITGLLILSGPIIFKNYWEKMRTLGYILMAYPGFLLLIYQVFLLLIPIIFLYKKFTKFTYFSVQQTINVFLDITIRKYISDDFEDESEYKAFIISKSQAELVKHPKWQEFINKGFKWYRQHRFGDAKLLPIIEVVYSKHHSNSFNTKSKRLNHEN